MIPLKYVRLVNIDQIILLPPTSSCFWDKLTQYGYGQDSWTRENPIFKLEYVLDFETQHVCVCLYSQLLANTYGDVLEYKAIDYVVWHELKLLH